MSSRRIDIFFYGLFMDTTMLRAKGINPVNPRQARVRGQVLRIGYRAALAQDRASSVFGLVMGLTHSEIEQLYSDPGVAMYQPEAVMAELAGGAVIAALCFNLPDVPATEEINHDYAKSLYVVAKKLGFPDHYVRSLKS
jgi:hypothetical protein